MLQPYELLTSVLLDIETGIRNRINASSLSNKYSMSEVHLRRLFNFAFKQPIARYIRSRKLAASLNDLLQTNANVLDIGVCYGFDYEQSYIRAFKREFGITPGEFRKTGQAVKVKPPIHLHNENKQDDSIFFGPDIVMVPQFHVVGKHHRLPFDSIILAPQTAKHFWQNERSLIKQAVNPDIYIGLTHNIDYEAESTEYLPSVQVKSLEYIPPGLYGHTFETSLCARFRYIGKHHYYDINKDSAFTMYAAIEAFSRDNDTGYALSRDKIYFEKIDTSLYDGTYCQMEWFAPVKEKQKVA